MTIDEPPIERSAQADAPVSADSTRPSAPTRFRLYLSLPTPTSVRGKQNLDTILAGLGTIAHNVSIETIDVAAHPFRATRDRIIVTPTLILCGGDAPPSIVGDFSDADSVRAFIRAALNTAVASEAP